jgi:hypothetical protein
MKLDELRKSLTQSQGAKSVQSEHQTLQIEQPSQGVTSLARLRAKLTKKETTPKESVSKPVAVEQPSQGVTSLARLRAKLTKKETTPKESVSKPVAVEQPAVSTYTPMTMWQKADLWNTRSMVGIGSGVASSLGGAAKGASFTADVATGYFKDIKKDIAEGNFKDIAHQATQGIATMLSGLTKAVKTGFDISTGVIEGTFSSDETIDEAINKYTSTTDTVDRGLNYISEALSSFAADQREAQKTKSVIAEELKNDSALDKFLKKTGQFYEGVGSDMSKLIAEKKARYGQDTTPTFTDELFNGIGNLPLFVLSGMGTKALASTLGFAEKGAAAFASGSNAIVEAGMEANQVYEEVLASGKTQEEATAAGLNAYGGNIALIALTNKVDGMFESNNLKGWKKFTSNVVGALGEGGQEGVQTMIQNANTGRPIMENVKKSFLIGIAIGGPAAAVFGVNPKNRTEFENYEPTEKEVDENEQLTPKQKEIVKKIINGTITEEEKLNLLTEAKDTNTIVDTSNEYAAGTQEYAELKSDISTLIDQGVEMSDIVTKLESRLNVSEDYATKTIGAVVADKEVATPATEKALSALPEAIATEIESSTNEDAIKAFEPFKQEYTALQAEVEHVDKQSARYAEILNRLVAIEDTVIRAAQAAQVTTEKPVEAPAPVEGATIEAPTTEAAPKAPVTPIIEAGKAGVKSLEEQLRAIYAANPKAEEALSNILVELEIAEAGSRVQIGDEFRAIPSTFPKWLPDNTRTKKSIAALSEVIKYVATITYPTNPRANTKRLLVDEMLNELDRRLGIDTSDIRSQILKQYEQNKTTVGANVEGGKPDTSTKEVKTQKEIVAEAISEKPKTIKEIAEETKILEPNVRRILGVGAKEGVFTRKDKGVYILSKDGIDTAYVHVGDAVDTLPTLAAEGMKADMVFLDIPYDTPAVKGGNRGVKYNLLSVAQFEKVLEATKKILRDVNAPVIHMYSQAESGLKAMIKYNDLFIKKGFIPVGKGEYQKTFADGSPVTSPNGQVAKPEGILVFTQSGKLKKGLKDLNFTLKRPKGYQTEKPAAMLKAMIEMTTEEGDTVLDPFAGSGVTGAEAVRTGRKAVLIEKDAKVAEEITKKRVERALAETVTQEQRDAVENKYIDDFMESNDAVTFDAFEFQIETEVFDTTYLARNKPEYVGITKEGLLNKFKERFGEDGKAKPTPKPTISKSVTVNTDVGEKIGGARKDIWGKSVEMFGITMTEKEVLEQPTAKLLPNIDYKALRDSGMKEETLIRVAFVKALIDKKPTRTWKQTQWAKQVIQARSVIKSMLESGQFDTSLEEKILAEGDLAKTYQATAAMYKALDFINNPDVSKYYVSAMTYTYSSGANAGKPITRYTLIKQGKHIESFYPTAPKNSVSSQLSSMGVRSETAPVQATETDVVAEAKKYFDKLNLRKEVAKDAEKAQEPSIEKYVGIYKNRLTGRIYSAYKKGKTLFEFETFNTLAEAQALYRTPERLAKYMQQLSEAVDFDENTFRKESTEVEGGRTYRSGDVSSQEFMETFGFRGVEFGNWVNKEERQDRLNRAYDSFKDLALILGVPDKAMSLNGELGFAFGSRGIKGANAHYESGKVVINLTKINGAGTIAHEWWHAFDNYLSRREGSKLSFVTENGYKGVELNAKIKELVTYLKNSGVGERSRKADSLKNSNYFSQTREMTARGFEVFIKESLKERNLKNSFLVSLLDVDGIPQQFLTAFPYAMGEEIPKVKQLYSDIVSNIKIDESNGETVAMYKEMNGPEVTHKVDTREFLDEVKSRLKIDFDTYIVDNILARYKQSALDEFGNPTEKASEGWGVTYDNTIAMVKDAIEGTAKHEVIHLTLANLDKIPTFAEKGMTREDILTAQAEEMGLQYENSNDREVEEALAKNFESYTRNEYKPKGIIARFFEYLKQALTNFRKAIYETNADIIRDYYDTVLYGEAVDDNVTRLENSGRLQQFMIGSVIDFNYGFEPQAKLKEKDTYDYRSAAKLLDGYDRKALLEFSDTYGQGKTPTKENLYVVQNILEAAKTPNYQGSNAMLFKDVNNLLDADRQNTKELMSDEKLKPRELDTHPLIQSKAEQLAQLESLEENIGMELIARKARMVELAALVNDIDQGLEEVKKASNVTELIKYTNKQDKLPDIGANDSVFATQGEALLQELGFENLEEARAELSKYLAQRVKYQVTRQEIGKVRKDLRALRATSKEIREQAREIERKLRINKRRVEDINRGIAIGEREGVKDYKYRALKRRQAMRAIEMSTAIPASTLKEIVGVSNLESMAEDDFQNMMNTIINRASEFAEKDALRKEIASIIMAKQLSKYDNFRASLGFPSFSTMTKPQLETFRDEIMKYEFGDVFLTQRELETIHRTRFGEVKTARELLNVLENAGISIKDLAENEIDVDSIQFANGTVLSQKSPFFAWLVQNRITAKIQAIKATHEFRTKLNKLVNAARKSDKRSVGDFIVPTDEKVFDYLDKGTGYDSLTTEQKALADFLKEHFKKAFLYMQDNYGMEGRQNYVTHIRRGFLEALKNTGDIGASLKEMFDADKMDEDVFNLMNTKTGQVIAFEKFLPYMLKRTGDFAPSKNLAKVANQYTNAIENKKALDKFIPEAMLAVSAYKALHGTTEKGLQKSPHFESFVKEFLNDAKGRSIRAITTQGSELDTLVRKFTTLVRLKFLGFNLVSSIANIVGDTVALSTLMVQEPSSFFTTLYRAITQPLKTFAISKKVTSLFEEDPVEALTDPSVNLPSRLANLMMFGFGLTGHIANNFYINSKLTKEEFESGIVSEARIQELANEMNKVKKNNFYVGSLIGSTAVGKMLTLFGNWTFPMATKMYATLFARGGLMDSLFINDKEQYFINKKGAIEWSKRDGKHLAAVLFVASMMTILAQSISDDDDKDKYAKTLKEKIIREMNTIFSAMYNPLNPNSYSVVFSQLKEVFLLAQMLLSQEVYTSVSEGHNIGEKKYPAQLKKVFLPSFLKQFESTDPIDSLTPEESTIYNVVKETERLGFNSDASKALVANLTKEQRTTYNSLKKKFFGNKKPSFESNKEIKEKEFINQIGMYAKAIGTDPVTAFVRLFEGEAIRRIDNGTIIIYRPDMTDTQAIKAERGGNTKALKLDHRIPLQLGGSNSNSNLVLETNEKWASYTPVENYLGKKLRSDEITKKEAQDAIIEFKEGKKTFEQLKAQFDNR